MARCVVELGHTDRHGAGFSRRRGELLHQRGAIGLDLLRLFAEQPRDLAQHVDEGRLAVTRRLGKVGAAPDRLAGGRQKHGQRPAAMFPKMMQRRHVDLIDVGPLLAIDFDVDEQLVHHARGSVILKTLMRHDVAPMTRRIADREQDRPTAAFGLRERVGAPGPPVNRVVLVLQQIWARLLGETVLLRTLRRR
jgi:hypothetical protein